MNETQFNTLIDETLIAIEEIIEHSNEDIDWDASEGILTLYFENETRIIINRQAPIKQLWLAAKQNGYHFNHQNNHWICDKSSRTLNDILQEAIRYQSNININFEAL